MNVSDRGHSSNSLSTGDGAAVVSASVELGRLARQNRFAAPVDVTENSPGFVGGFGR